ncbi:sodium:calcium antiporter [Virgibacillus senegalensis]|uniref:sodium:calcium antiporter n=1 Tax=Virgibacillus senegalensis TaxID=1499679 RepID=UPI000B10B512|nr:sodium:calcium antiporter [Virgibacillus senegalensis]
MIIFFVTAAISVFSAIKLSTYADIISKQTKLGGMLAGTLLLAVATSLPELTATVSAAAIGNADIAIGNGLGSIIFNFLVLFVLDLYFRKHKLFLRVSNNHFHTGLLSLILGGIAGLAIYFRPDPSYMGIGLTSLIIASVYLIGIGLISMKQRNDKKKQADTPESEESMAMRKVVALFIAYAGIIFFSGSGLSISGDWMASTTGISETAVGTLLIAMTTSLPDAVGVYVALKKANINLAIGAILGSNLFNVFVVTVSDAFYRSGSLWSAGDVVNMWTAAVGSALTFVVLLLLKRKRTRNTFTYSLPSLFAVACYILFIGFILYY